MGKYDIKHSTEAQAVEKLRSEQRQRIEAIRQDRNLSPDGRRAQIAALYLRNKREVAALEQREAATRTNRVNEIRKTVFGLSGNPGPQDVISYRDAQDRVANLEADDEAKAAQLFDRAQLSGDSILAAAVVNRALEAGWVGVANSYIEANPYKGAMVEELWDLNQANADSQTNIVKVMESSAAFHLDKPHELSHVHLESQIEAIAGEA